MKILVKPFDELQAASRWDIDFHLPPIGITRFDPGLLQRVDQVADVSSSKRNPTKSPDLPFQYIDISCVDSTSGMIGNTQDLLGEEAPSRARKVVQALDVLVSTVRPTRGAIAVVPPYLHNQIASTGFSVLRPKAEINPFFLHFALRLPSTLEQFRKWSTGSSYPAILDEDVAKTLIPVPPLPQQDEIVATLFELLLSRIDYLARANTQWEAGIMDLAKSLANSWDDGESADVIRDSFREPNEWMTEPSAAALMRMVSELAELDVDAPTRSRAARSGRSNPQS